MRRGADQQEWVEAAMADDSLVVDLLVSLHRRKDQPVNWTLRQRRSKSVSHRASPTTPLSWSDATEESIRKPRKLAGSKVLQVKIDSQKFASKRSRKKKTLAELRDEQILLLKERRELEREISSVHENLESQRATNAALKRMKIELLPRMDQESSAVVEEATCSHHNPSPRIRQLSNSQNDQSSTSDSDPEKHTVAASSDPKFILPDLNIPFDELNSDTITGVS